MLHCSLFLLFFMLKLILLKFYQSHYKKFHPYDFDFYRKLWRTIDLIKKHGICWIVCFNRVKSGAEWKNCNHSHYSSFHDNIEHRFLYLSTPVSHFICEGVCLNLPRNLFERWSILKLCLQQINVDLFFLFFIISFSSKEFISYLFMKYYLRIYVYIETSKIYISQSTNLSQSPFP